MHNPSEDDEVDSRRCRRKEITQIKRKNARSQLPLYNDNELVNVNVEISALPCTKRQKLVSNVREDYLKDKGEDGRECTICKHCKMVVGSNNNRTTNLKKHLERCQNRRNGGDGVGDSLSETGPPSAVIRQNRVVDEERKHFDVARMIIKNGILSLNSLKADILHVHREEKEKLREFFSKLPCRLSLTVDCLQRYTDDNLCYCLTVHFIDDNWELKREIISVKCLEGGNSIETLKSVLLDWNIHGSIIAADVPQAHAGIRYWLRSQGSLCFGGSMISINYVLFVQEDIISVGVELAIDIFEKLRKSFDYVYETSNQQNFFAAVVDNVRSEEINGVPPTSDMQRLERAVGYKEAFLCLARPDPVFKSITLKGKEWNKASELNECYQMWKDAASILYGDKTLTANMFFPKLCEIHRKLNQLEEKSRWLVTLKASSMIYSLLGKFDSSCSSVLAIAAVLDPRFKKDIVKRWCRKLDDTDYDIFYTTIIGRIKRALREYKKGSASNLKSTAPMSGDDYFSTSYDMLMLDGLASPSISLVDDDNEDEEEEDDDDDYDDSVPCNMLDNLGRPCGSSKFDDNEFRRYLQEPKHPLYEDFDILGWWRFNARRFPMLARMARDFLSISFATPHNCSFDVVDKLVNSKDLDSDIMEAFICTKGWLEKPSR